MVRTRFAPSPTGFMHIGNLRTCLYAYYFARKNKGTFVLRIEDTDQERLVEGAVDKIYSTLKLAGITHDEGPDVGGAYAPYVQSARKESGVYLEYAQLLVELGGAYYCFCNAGEISEIGDDKGIKKYNKKCLSLSKEEVQSRLNKGDSYVIRQNVPTTGVSEYDDMVFGKISVPNIDIEDGVLIKSDGMPTYNFANVIDDHLMNITHVIRGMEYLSSTPKYNLMYDAFGWERPQYMHLPPIMKDAQRKLSKRYGDANFEDFITKGYLVEAIVNYITLLGWSPNDNREKMSMEELIDAFDVAGVSHSGSIFDEAKLRWLNAEYIKAMDVEQFLEVATGYIEKSAVAGMFDYTKLAVLLIPRVEILSEISDKIDVLAKFEGYDLALFDNKKQKITPVLAKEVLEKCCDKLNLLVDWSEEGMQAVLADIIESGGYKKAQVFLSLRVALTGAAMTPGGATEMADLFGMDESIRRLKYSIAYLADSLVSL